MLPVGYGCWLLGAGRGCWLLLMLLHLIDCPRAPAG